MSGSYCFFLYSFTESFTDLAVIKSLIKHKKYKSKRQYDREKSKTVLSDFRSYRRLELNTYQPITSYLYLVVIQKCTRIDTQLETLKIGCLDPFVLFIR